jgi:hypothetical protein
MGQDEGKKSPLLSLEQEDQDFVLRLLLAEGSLKDLAQAYGVSYPTIRVRLDRLIGRVKQILDGQPPDPMAELLGSFVERGEMTPGAARSILDLHRRAIRSGKEHDHESTVV